MSTRKITVGIFLSLLRLHVFDLWGFVDLTFSWKLQTLKHEISHRFRVNVDSDHYDHPPMTLLHCEWTPRGRKTHGQNLLYKCFRSPPLQRRCQSTKKNERLFICRLWNWLYGGKKHFAHFQRSTSAAHFHGTFCKHMYLFTFPQPHISIRCTAAAL